MAVTVLNSGINQEKGITYTVITDSSVDWTGVTNDTYFYDFGDGLVHYKDSTGTVLNMFASGGSSDTLYSDDGTVGSGRIVTLTDTLTFKGSNTSGSTSNLKIVDSTSSTLWDFRNNGDIHTSKNSTINLVDNITFKEGVLVVENGTVETTSIATFSDVSGNQKWDWRANGDLYVNQDSILNLSGVLDFKLPAQNAKTILFESTQVSTSKIGFNIFNYPLQIFENSTNEWWVANVESSILGNDGDFIIHNRLGSLNAFVAKDNGTILLNSGSSTSPIGTEDISLQGSTLVNDKFEIQTTTAGMLMPRLTTAQMNAISSPDTHLLIFNTDLNALYRYDGSAWVAMSAGYGIISINDSSGNPTFYTDLQSAVNATSADDEIAIHSDITLTSQVSITKRLRINMNGNTITLNSATTDNALDISYVGSNGVFTFTGGGKILRTGGSASIANSLCIRRSTSDTLDLGSTQLYNNFGTCIYALGGGDVLRGHYWGQGIAIAATPANFYFANVYSNSSSGFYSNDTNTYISNSIINAVGSGVSGRAGARHCEITAGANGVSDCRNDVIGNIINAGGRGVDVGAAGVTVQGNVINSTGIGIFSNSTTEIIGNTVISVDSAIYALSGSNIISNPLLKSTNATVIIGSQYGDVIGNTIIGTSTGSVGGIGTGNVATHHILNNYIEIANASGHAISAASGTLVYSAGNTFKGMTTPLSLADGNQQANTNDGYGNILIG